jgi:hypothetical protein
MVNRLDVGEGQELEDARKQFDNQMGVKAWRMPGQAVRPEIEEALSDPAAPSWWLGEEDASQSFLQSMGVTLNDGN